MRKFAPFLAILIITIYPFMWVTNRIAETWPRPTYAIDKRDYSNLKAELRGQKEPEKNLEYPQLVLPSGKRIRDLRITQTIKATSNTGAIDCNARISYLTDYRGKIVSVEVAEVEKCFESLVDNRITTMDVFPIHVASLPLFAFLTESTATFLGPGESYEKSAKGWTVKKPQISR